MGNGNGVQVEVLRSFSVDGRPIGARQQQLLLVALVAAHSQGHPNVDREGLRRALGSDATPAAVTHALKRLRAAFPAGALAQNRKYEALLIEDGATDVGRFIAAAHPALRTHDSWSEYPISTMDEALALCPPTLWPELLDLTDDAHQHLVAFRDRLESTRRSVAVRRAECLLALDRPAEAGTIETDAAADDRWAPDHQEALVIACVRWANGGREAAIELLSGYPTPSTGPLSEDWSRIRAALAQGEPWSATLLPRRPGEPPRRGAAHLGAASAASTLRRAGSRWRGVIERPKELFGRSEQMLQLTRFVDGAPSGQVSICLISGGEHSGKSAFLRHGEAMLMARGTRTATAQCLADYRRPLGVALELLHQLDPTEAERIDRDTTDGARRIALAARALAAATVDAPVALVIDDAQCIDHSSLGVLEMIRVMRTGGKQLLVVAAVRPDAPGASPDAVRHLDASLSNDNAVSIRLDPLGEGDAAALCRDVLGLPLDFGSVWALGEHTDWAAGEMVVALRHLSDAGLILLDDSTLFFAEHALERISDTPTAVDKLQVVRELCRSASSADDQVMPHHRRIAHACLELHLDSIPLAGDDIDRGVLTAQLTSAAAEFESDKTWILAARTWDCIIQITEASSAQQVVAVRSGRAWMRAHDAAKAISRLEVARGSSDARVRVEASEYLGRTIASLATFDHGDRVTELADIAVAELASKPGLGEAVARVQCVAAEWLAVFRRYDEARTRVASARSLIGDARSAEFAQLESSAGIVELLAAQPASAYGYFLNAQAHCAGDQWILSGAAARALMCLAESSHDAVTPAAVTRAKTIAAGAHSWSDYLLSCLAGAHAALMCGDVTWGQQELIEARHIEIRAGYPLAAEPLRMLWGHAFDGEWIDDPSHMSSPLAKLWATSHGEAFRYRQADHDLMQEVAARLVADTEATGVDLWNAAQSAVGLDLAARFDPSLSATLAPLAQALRDSSHASVLGVVAALDDHAAVPAIH